MFDEATGVSPFSCKTSQEVCQKAINIAEYFYANTLDLYRFVNRDSNMAKLRNALMQLPATFSTREAVEIGLALGYSDTAVKQHLKDNIGISLEKISNGIYKKTK